MSFLPSFPRHHPPFNRDSLFVNPPVRWFDHPVPGTIEFASHTLMVSYSGSWWRVRWHGLQVPNLVAGQVVHIVGRQGNHLLIRLEREADE
jgi:hypothetical protein